MKQAILTLSVAAILAAAQADAPQFSADNQLVRPAKYREWVWLSSGLGMSYSAPTTGEPSFDNVFVSPAAYREFAASGKWPEKTLFVLEDRESVSKGSINKSGHFQGALTGLVAEVKDTARFGGWAFFNFSGGEAAKPLPKNAACYSCHAEHGAVDNTFVQFYPTLLEIAKQKGTLRPTY